MRDNVSLSSTNEVLTICKPFFARTGINAFSYSRVYHDGSRAELWTDYASLCHTFLQKKYINGAYTPCLYRETEHYALLSCKIESFPADIRARFIRQLADQRELFDFDHCFKVIRNKDGYFEYFIFYSPKTHSQAPNFYINNLDLLENFASYFTKVAAPLIESASATRLILPQTLSNVQNVALRCVENDVQRNRPYDGPQHHTLTERQLQIARLMLDGRTARRIGEELGLSSRTVESHIENMKSRLACNSRSELFVRFSSLGLLTQFQ